MPCGVNMFADWSQCVGHRPGCGTNGVGLSIPGPNTQITASQVEALRSAIAGEVSTWKAHRFYSGQPLPGGAISAGSYALASDWNLMEQSVHFGSGAAVGATPHNEITGDYIRLTDNFIQLKNDYDSIRQDCICNSDCGCNTVCVCNVDCGCNYSDKRLKMEIAYC